MKKTVRVNWKNKVFSGSIDDFKDNIHDIAYSNPYYSEVEHLALKEDINTNGQQDPIFVSAGKNGKVFDGKNRIRALLELGITEVLYAVAPVNYTKKEMQMVADSKETRRHQTVNQKAIKAWKYTKDGGGTKTGKDVGLKYGVDKQLISKINTVLNNLPAKRHDEFILSMQDNEFFNATSQFKSKSIESIARHLSKLKVEDKTGDGNMHMTDADVIREQAMMIKEQAKIIQEQKEMLQILSKRLETVYPVSSESGSHDGLEKETALFF